ncbi:hypothetical protein DSO57_1030379 [Entomophthora muscae]|uniref:Uncharacterized protein n=1 Tax=Entomophthora muscae TaxID=34485 RepID=A0ACC2UAQ1_9FUNG|nr:hypothetical protein DSO57_1030379 [Entomophthora muscae]
MLLDKLLTYGFYVNVKTVGHFSTHSPLLLDKKTGWTNPSQLTSFHLKPVWYPNPRLIGHRSKVNYADATYYFRGGYPVSDRLHCPTFVHCLLTATWQNSTWTPRCSKFIPKGDKIPQRITRVAKEQSTYFIIVKGPWDGRILFNPLALATRSYVTSPSPRVTANPHLEITHMLLPSGLPDGVIGIV